MEVQTKLYIINPFFLTLASLSYSHFLVSKFPNGIFKFISLLPIFYFFSILPWFFSSSISRGISSFFITWITSFKLILFCFQQGPLFPNISYLDFVVISIFPLKIRENPPPKNTNYDYKTLILLVGISLPFILSSILNIFFLYFVSVVCMLLLTLPISRYELVPFFDHPYRSKSLREFWGIRWNQMSSNILRLTIYSPTRKTLTGIIGPGPAKVMAKIVTLIVSGIMHEIVFYYITCGTRPTWEVTYFFVLHGVCMVMEAALSKVWVKHWRPIHPAMSNFLTVGFVMVTFYWLLVLPVWRNGKNQCDMRWNYFVT